MTSGDRGTPSVNNKNNNTARPLDAVAALIMVALTLSWGLNQVSIKLTLPEIPPFIQATVRSIGAFAIIALWARARGVSLTIRDGTLAGGILAGVLFGLEFLLIFPALQFTAASRATLFIYTAPFVVALGSTALLGEKLRAAQWLGLLCSFAGLVVAFGMPDASGGKQLVGDLMMIGAGIAWGATTLVRAPTCAAPRPRRCSRINSLFRSRSLRWASC